MNRATYGATVPRQLVPIDLGPRVSDALREMERFALFSVVAGNLRFPKTRRLTRNDEFRRVRKEGQSVRGDSLMLAYLNTAEKSPARAGFITSKRVGNAVLRNRTRRRLREIFRRHQHEIAPGTWLVVIASARAPRVPFAALEDEWLRLARRAFILAP